MDQPAYRLVVSVCQETADKLQRNVCQYFTDLIVQHSENEDYEQIAKAHELIKQLNRSVPQLLHNVVPQLEEELRVEDTQIRVLATQVLGEMFSDKGGTEFVKKYPTTWNFWLHRKNDKAPVVRLTFVEAVKSVLINLPEVRAQIEGNSNTVFQVCDLTHYIRIVLLSTDALDTKLLDPDEKVRAAVCKLYSQLDYETALHHVSPDKLKAVAGRGLDKKVLDSISAGMVGIVSQFLIQRSVQYEAMTAVGRLYSLASPEMCVFMSVPCGFCIPNRFPPQRER